MSHDGASYEANVSSIFSIESNRLTICATNMPATKVKAIGETIQVDFKDKIGQARITLRQTPPFVSIF